MALALSPHRAAALVRGFDASPAYEGLAGALALVIGDGRVPVGTRLPSERELAAALGLSRTTVTRAYALLRQRGFARARHGSGTYAHLSGRRRDVVDRVLVPLLDRPDLIDLGSAATSAPPGVAAALAGAVDDVTPYLGGHGYYPGGIPELQEAIAAHYESRGLPTSPDQVLVTPGALAAAAIVVHALTGPRDRVLVETPSYPNARRALAGHGATLVPNPVDEDGWDLATVAHAVRHARAGLAYLVPDFQNPTGHLMPAEQRERYAELLRAAGTVPVVDEAGQQLYLEDGEMPPPFAAYHPGTVTLGSASKIFWGGLRLGWVRAPRDMVDDLVAARVALDLGTPVLEQLALARLLTGSDAVADAQRSRLREQRDALLAALAERLPDWRVGRPRGGLTAWCELPAPVATAFAEEAEQHGVVVAPGSQFDVEGRLESYVRLPWIRPVHELEEAVRRLADAWHEVGERPVGPARARRLTVA